MGWSKFIPTLLILGSLLEGTLGIAEYLLPGDIVPYHYDLTLLYDVDPATNFSYYGNVDIYVTCRRPTDKVILHGQLFSLYNEKIAVQDGNTNFTVNKATMNETFNFLTLYLDRNLQENKNYTLTIPFYGNLDMNLDGVYISTYKTKTGNKEYLVATQFEAISARKGLPCFDEPTYKATFKVAIGHNSGFSAISNMPIYNSTGANLLEHIWTWKEIEKTFKKDQGLFVWDKFENSVPMSTYLLAFVVSKFSNVESPPGLADTKFKIWTRSDAIDQADYASNIGPKVLSNFEKWFNVSFPLPKQDMIAIPDFASGAMENWGLITYRETALLYDEKESSFTAKERVASVVAHELAHQWFGNLVTMKWWSDLWLNEGFATYVGSLGVEKVEPTWAHADHEAAENMRRVFTLDGLESSHPVSVPIENPNKIQEIFDDISYRKGAFLIRMMVMFLGEDTFREGIKNYLMKYSYKNAEQDDLWSELTEAARANGKLPTGNVTVKELMDTWTTQTGYPLITVTRNYINRSMDVTQKRFLSLGGEPKNNSSWWVPLNVICECDLERKTYKPMQWMSDKDGIEKPYSLEHYSENNQWLLLNADLIGLYRVNYDQMNWKLLIDTLNSVRYKDIPTLNRAQLLTDSFALAWSNVIDYKTALQLGSYLHRETDHIPLETGLSALAKINGVLQRTSDYGAFQKFIRKLITNSYERFGGLSTKSIQNDKDLTSVKMQVMLSSWACRVHVPGCQENAMELFKQWMNTEDPDNNNPIPLDLRSAVYCVGARRGSLHEWRFLFERYIRTNVAAARTAAMVALACTNEVWLLKQYLEWSVGSGVEVRRQDAATVIISIARQPVGFYLARDFLYHRIEDIYNAFNGQGRRLGGIIKTVVSQFTTQQELDEFISWSESNSKYLAEARLAVAQAIESARVNVAWITKHRQPVVNLMREYAQ